MSSDYPNVPPQFSHIKNFSASVDHGPLGRSSRSATVDDASNPGAPGGGCTPSFSLIRVHMTLQKPDPSCCPWTRTHIRRPTPYSVMNQMRKGNPTILQPPMRRHQRRRCPSPPQVPLSQYKVPNLPLYRRQHLKMRLLSWMQPLTQHFLLILS
jgi:hypothetical protein